MNCKLIELGNKVDCLIAKRKPAVVALYQPMLALTVTDIGGPCYDSNREAAVSKVEAFLSHANEKGFQLIILPEFATPIEILINICKGTIRLSESTLLVLPLEALSLTEYRDLTDNIGKIASKLELCGLEKHHVGTTWVNACAVVAVTSEGVEVYVQQKRWASVPEVGTLCCGSDYFVFRGNGIAMSVFVCADANEADVYGEQIKNTRTAAHGSYFVHIQWNQQPRYEIYKEFWRRIIATDPDDNILLSLNMAAKSSIRKSGGTETISLPFTFVAFSGDAKIDEKYMTLQTYSTFKSVFRNKWGTIFNIAYPYDSCHLIVLRRPYEVVDDAVNSTKTFLISSKMFLSDSGTFAEYLREDIASSFIKYLVNINARLKDEIINQIKDLTFEDIEILIASCLQEEKYKWLEKDILLRPFIWSTFFSPLGIQNEYSRDAIDYFVTTLKKLDQCNALGYRIMPFEKISRYPINLVSNNDDGYGWIFNCKGLSDVRISEAVTTSLLNTDCIRKEIIITLFPTNCTAAFCADVFEKIIINAARKISDPVDNLSQDFDVTSPEARPSIRVNVL